MNTIIIIFCLFIIIIIGINQGWWQYVNCYKGFGEFHILPFAYFYSNCNNEDEEELCVFYIGWMVFGLIIELKNCNEDIE